MARAYLTTREWHDLLVKQGGVCCVPGCGSKGPFDGEHTVANYFIGGKPDALMCRPCHKAKTRKDKADIARTKRLNGDSLSQYERRRRFGPSLKGNSSFKDFRHGR